MPLGTRRSLPDPRERLSPPSRTPCTRVTFPHPRDEAESRRLVVHVVMRSWDVTMPHKKTHRVLYTATPAVVS